MWGATLMGGGCLWAGNFLLSHLENYEETASEACGERSSLQSCQEPWKDVGGGEVEGLTREQGKKWWKKDN